MPRGGRYGTYVILICLQQKMIQADATIVALADVAGVSHSTIKHALCGKEIHEYIGRCLYEALNTRKFKRSNQGRRFHDKTQEVKL